MSFKFYFPSFAGCLGNHIIPTKSKLVIDLVELTSIDFEYKETLKSTEKEKLIFQMIHAEQTIDSTI